ncbi:MAG: hypothetical protein II842_18285 [Butyrivibrio sp.]|nr:hypothetical protein [Butyrivibrio sp.]
MEIFIDKLYRYDRILEPCYIGFPLKKGLIFDTENISLMDPAENALLPTQIKVTSRYGDGSVRFIFIRFLADIPANEKCSFTCNLPAAGEEPESCSLEDTDFRRFNPVRVKETSDGIEVSTVDDVSDTLFSYTLKSNSEEVFDLITADDRTFPGKQLSGPILKKSGDANAYSLKTGDWKVVEDGPVCAILKTQGTHINNITKETLSFELKLTAFAGKSYTEVSYRIINDTDNPFDIESLRFQVKRNSEGKVRTIAASSNYKTDYVTGENGEKVEKVIDSDFLMKESNEHFAETFYGTLFADFTDNDGGVCATIYQAQQNYPKAAMADADGLTLFLVPEDVEKVILESGMSREQKFLLHFHSKEEEISSLNDRSIVYQMPYRPYVLPDVQKESGVWPNIFPSKNEPKFERCLIAKADNHCRCYGMLNFGDSYDSNYTAQGRGGGKLIWSNNEYDYPHACALLYARTGIRRFLDYNIASASHWMDVDVCHYHKDPLYIGGQWEHTKGHVIDGVMVCSHEWVEGLLDYYHFTGDVRGLETAIGIGENVKKLLDLPMYAKAGESSARETGWALRTLTALYIETSDKTWLSKCEKILDDFKTWEKQYGHWFSPYTDNTIIRVPFMISIAVGSLARYYKQFPDEELKGLILRAVDDMIENCYVESLGLFYYKELPSLSRLGNNPLLLEALTIAYDLSGDSKYLEYGIETFKNNTSDAPSYTSAKKKAENSVIVGTVSSKGFAQSMIPLAGFQRALTEAGM